MVTTSDGPAVHVWDLRAIRRQLARMGLDWDAPAFSDDDPAAPSPPPLPPLKSTSARPPLTGLLDPRVYEPLIADLEAALASIPDQPRSAECWPEHCNNYAWKLATATGIEPQPPARLRPGPPRRRAGPDPGHLPQHAGRRPVSRGPIRRGRRDAGTEPGRRPRRVRRLRPLLPGHGPQPAGTWKRTPVITSTAP